MSEVRAQVLELACRFYPRPYRDDRCTELVDTALEASARSRIRFAREALSLTSGGLRTRARLTTQVEFHEVVAEGALLCAWLLAIVNLAVALYGVTARVHVLDDPVLGLYLTPSYGPYVVDWWWLSYAAVSAGLVISLVYGLRTICMAMASAIFVLVASDASFLANGSNYDGDGHFDLFTYAQTSSFPGGREWVAAASVLALSTILSRNTDATPARRPARATVGAFALALVLVVIARETWGAFFFLRWGVLAIVLLAVALGALAPRLPIVAAGVAVAALPSAFTYLTATNLSQDIVLTLLALLAFTVGLLVPFAYAMPGAMRRRGGTRE